MVWTNTSRNWASVLFGRAQHGFDIVFEMRAETGAQFAVGGEADLVAGVAEMEVGHCADEAETDRLAVAVPQVADFVIQGRAVAPDFLRRFGKRDEFVRFSIWRRT